MEQTHRNMSKMDILGHPRSQKGKIAFSTTKDVQKLKFCTDMLFHIGNLILLFNFDIF